MKKFFAVFIVVFLLAAAFSSAILGMRYGVDLAFAGQTQAEEMTAPWWMFLHSTVPTSDYLAMILHSVMLWTLMLFTAPLMFGLMMFTLNRKASNTDMFASFTLITFMLFTMSVSIVEGVVENDNFSYMLYMFCAGATASIVGIASTVTAFKLWNASNDKLGSTQTV